MRAAGAHLGAADAGCEAVAPKCAPTRVPPPAYSSGGGCIFVASSSKSAITLSSAWCSSPWRVIRSSIFAVCSSLDSSPSNSSHAAVSVSTLLPEKWRISLSWLSVSLTWSSGVLGLSDIAPSFGGRGFLPSVGAPVERPRQMTEPQLQELPRRRSGPCPRRLFGPGGPWAQPRPAIQTHSPAPLDCFPGLRPHTPSPTNPAG